ncbi:MAG: succinate dehydrogenase / fumarate reductase membrane anchor subunit, partial [Paracoccaceae bacterium]
MSFLTDYKRVAGLGSAKSGTGHFVQQRLTAIALIPLTVLFLYTFIGALGSG